MENRKISATHHRKSVKALIGRKDRKCNKCGFVTFSLYVLHKHKYKCKGQLLGKSISCPYCRRKFNFLTLYRTHKISCVKKSTRKKVLRRKLKVKCLRQKKKSKQDSQSFSLSCPICRTSFKSKSKLASHLKQANCTSQSATKKGSFSARKSLNNRRRNKSSDFKDYPSSSKLDEFANSKGHVCDWCKSAYPSQQLFFMHLKMNEDCAEAWYKNHMNSKNKKLPSKARKTVHVVARKSFPHRKHTSNVFNSIRTTSKKARKSFGSSYKNKSHGKSIDSARKSVLNQCPVCYETFPDTFTFYQHQKKTNHWGKATKSFTSTCKCPFCSKEFMHIKSRNAHLYSHSEKTHFEIKAFLNSCICSICSQVFVSKTAKFQHIKIEHPSLERNIKQSGSPRRNFMNDNDYSDKHKMSSVPSSVKKKLKQQPNTCPVCSKAFNHTVLRNKHFNEVHLKIFECQFCNTKFKSTSSLSNHIKLSHGKSLDCKDCRITFSNEIEVLQHIVKYHPNRDPKMYLPSKPKEKLPDDIQVRYMENKSFSNNTPGRNIEYYCDVCNIGYLKLCGLQRHRQSKLHKDTLVKNLDAFQKSLSDLPPSPPPYPKVVKQPEILTCSECSADFTSIKDFVPHRLSHFSFQGKYLKINHLNPYMCEICSDVLDSHSKVQLHLFWHLQIESTSAKNTNTGASKNDTIVPDRHSGQHVAKKSFSKPSNETLQEVVIGGVAKPLFTCEACKVGFTSKESYNIHVRKLCKKLKPTKQFPKQPGSKMGVDKNLKDAIENDIVHCGNCNFLFSSEGKLIQHKEFCVKCDFDDDSEENMNNSEILKSVLNSGPAIAGCITCAALFDNISSVAVHLSVHQNDDSYTEEIPDVLHCALCNCLFPFDSFKMHKDFCKTPINRGDKMENSKHINVLKSALELKCAVAACVSCGVPFEDLEAFAKHLALHQTNQIQNESDKLCNGEMSKSADKDVNKDSLDDSADSSSANLLTFDIVDGDKIPDNQIRLNSPLGVNDKHSLIDSIENTSFNLDSKQISEATDEILDLRNNFSQLFCVLISDDPELMKKLGYGREIIDNVLINVLQQMGQEPCTDTDISEIDLFRKNIQTFLDLCIKDQVLEAIGKDKSVDELVVEALKYFASEEEIPDDQE